MKYSFKIDRDANLLFLFLEGDVFYDVFLEALNEAKRRISLDPSLNLLIDGDDIKRFNISNEICQQVASQLFGQFLCAAFFSRSALAFGMLRVIQSYSFNEKFGVFKSREEAARFIAGVEVATPRAFVSKP